MTTYEPTDDFTPTLVGVGIGALGVTLAIVAVVWWWLR